MPDQLGDDEIVEIGRIRSAYAERDRQPARHRAITAAYRLVNADRRARMQALIERVSGNDRRILDVGCGGGQDLAHWLDLGWPAEGLAGVDLVARRIDQARQHSPGIDFRVTSGSDLPFPDDSFDLVTAVTVFSSILDPDVRRRVFREMQRVVRPSGSVLVYDFVIRNPRNHDVVAMTPSRVAAMAGRTAEYDRITPLIHLVAVATLLGDRATAIAMRIAPRTHRLWRWGGLPGSPGSG
jgi:ubiquinone/menaquinone biosynthesis C-methylase UbiE